MTTATTKRPQEAGTLATIRKALLALLLPGCAGTLVELLLLEHTEGWQRVPLVLLAAGLAVLAWHGLARGRASVRALQATMVAFVASGLAGMVLHYRGNVEFERELHPSQDGLERFRAAMMGATPALAPGTMMLLGGLGLAWTYRHPALAASARRGSNQNGGTT